MSTRDLFESCAVIFVLRLHLKTDMSSETGLYICSLVAGSAKAGGGDLPIWARLQIFDGCESI